MGKRKNPKKSCSSPRTEIKFDKCAGAGGKENKFAAFEFNSDDLAIEASARKTCSKFADKSPKKRPALSNSVEKYDFLACFGSTNSQNNGPGKEPFKVDIKDDVLKDGAMPLPSPGTMFQSLSLSVKPGCSSGTTGSCAYSSRNSGGQTNEKKHMPKPLDSIGLYEDGRIDSQASTSFSLLKKEGSVGDRSSCPRSNGNECEAVVIASPNYIKYEGTHYRECSLTFSSGFIRMKGLPINGRDRLYSREWPTSDIVKIKYWPCEYVEADVLNLQFKFYHADADETCSERSGIKKLEFVIIDDPQWSKKQDEIKSLNVKYELAWEPIMSDCNTKDHFDGMAYPDEDPDSVSIRESDVERLQPRTFLNDSIIDFYTKYLFINAIKPEERKRFHFFNTFFFRKLADTDKGFPKTRDGRQAFERVCKWTRNLELFEKDYILIPINYSLHWSLIVICYPGALANVREKHRNGSSVRPCILHMDSLKGSHGGFENLIRRYLWEEWKEKYGTQDASIRARFLNMPFQALKVPQQENSFDCGIFLLEYAEHFLAKAPNFRKSTDFSVLNETLFLPTEVSIKKREKIRRLIYKLAEERASKNPYNDSHFSSVVTEEDDSGIKVLDKETFEGLKSNPQTKVDESLTEMFEQEYTVMSRNDENALHREKHSNMRLLMEREGTEGDFSPFVVSASKYEGDDRTPCKLLVSSLMIGQMEVHLNTPTSFSCVSPMIIDGPNEKDCVIEIGSNSEKRKDKDVCSSMSKQELADCIVEDSEDDETVVECLPKPKRPFRNPQKT